MLQRLQRTQNTSVCFRRHGISRDTLILKLVKKAFGIGHWLIFLVEALRLDRAWRATEHFHRFQPLQSTYWYAPPQGGCSKPSSQPWSLFPLLEGFAGPFFSVPPLTSFLLATPSYIAKSLVEVKQEECPFPPCWFHMRGQVDMISFSLFRDLLLLHHTIQWCRTQISHLLMPLSKIELIA